MKRFVTWSLFTKVWLKNNFDTNAVKLVAGQTDQSFVADIFETNIR